MALESAEKANLRQFLVNRFSFGELKDLAFDLGVDYEVFSHETKPDLSRCLITYFEERDILSCLVIEIARRRRHNELAQLLTKLPKCSPTTKIQIIVDRNLLGLIDVSKVRKELAAKFQVNENEIAIMGAAWGSMRLLVGIPEKVADQRVVSEIHSLCGGDYQVASIEFFDSLDSASQKAWRLLARDKPPVGQGNALRPVFSWEEALKATREAPSDLDGVLAERSWADPVRAESIRIPILIAEDNPDWASTLKGFLVDANYSESDITTAANESEALSAIVQRPYDLAIVDLRLHGTEDDDSGISLALAIRKLSPRTKIIMQTGYGAPPTKVVRAIRYSGIADFIEKSQLGSEGDVDLALLVRKVLEKPEFEEQPEAGCLAVWLEPGYPLLFRARGEYVCANRTTQALDLDRDKYRERARVAFTMPQLKDRIAEIKDIGERIYESIFLDHTEMLSAYAAVKATKALTCLSMEAYRELLDLPLEFMFDHHSGDYVVLDRPMYRVIAGVAPRRKALTPRILAGLPGKLRVLLVASNTHPPIERVDEEVEELADRLSERRDLVEIRTIPTEKATRNRVREEIVNWQPHVFHYAGHGHYDSASPDESCLLFWPRENKSGRLVRLRSRELKTLLQESDVRLVYLSCCSGAATGESAALLHDDFLGLVDAVVQGGVPTVLGYRWPVQDKRAPRLACAFYESLLQHGHPGVALWRARCELADIDKNSLTWLSPIMVHQA